jgi:cellulose synthase/poly-beta-1,6-N-acetylglucosamine synthase-like glycosyltransferase
MKPSLRSGAQFSAREAESMKTTRTPKVSIVIPVYNGAEYLKETFESLLSQSFETLNSSR